MIKTPEHRRLAKRVRSAELAVHNARLVLQAAREELRAYRAANKRPYTLPGSGQIEKVAAALSTTQRKTVRMIADEIGGDVRRVRPLLAALVENRRAKRFGYRYSHAYYTAVPQRRAAE